MMEINGRAGRPNLANFKVIFDLFIVFISFCNKKYKLYYVSLRNISEIRAKEHIGLVTAQSSKHPQILATTLYWPNDYP